MPNWCESDLNIRGPEAEIVRFMKAAFPRPYTKMMQGDPSFIESLVPMPEELSIEDSWMAKTVDQVFNRGVLDPLLKSYWAANKQKIETIADAKKLLKKQASAADFELAKKYKANRERHGAIHWYDWCCREWGCKWPESNLTRPKRTTGGVSFSYSTPWSPPDAALLKIAKKFPKLKFENKWFECGMAVRGVLTYVGGKLVGSTQREYKGRRGG